MHARRIRLPAGLSAGRHGAGPSPRTSGGAGTVGGVSASCSRPTCGRPASATLTYDYAARSATVDDLAPSHPMQYDLCATHAERLSVPNGWTMVDRRVGRVVDLPSRIAS